MAGRGLASTRFVEMLNMLRAPMMRDDDNFIVVLSFALCFVFCFFISTMLSFSLFGMPRRSDSILDRLLFLESFREC